MVYGISDQALLVFQGLTLPFAKQISKEKIFGSTKGKPISKDIQTNLQTVDLGSLEQLQSKEIGAEWLVKQAFDALDIPSLLTDIGLNQKEIKEAQLLLTAKLVHPSSELETQRWLNHNSGAPELYDYQQDITRYALYQGATKMYAQKKYMDTRLYSKSFLKYRCVKYTFTFCRPKLSPFLPLTCITQLFIYIHTYARPFLCENQNEDYHTSLA